MDGISSNVVNTNIMVVAKDFAGLLLRPGQIFTGVIVSQAKDGEQYLLKTGDSLLSVRSERPLQIGEQIRLHVLGFKGEDLLVEKLLGNKGSEDSKQANAIAKAIAKFGFKGEKETAVIKEALLKLPLEENTAVRYLLDPHLFTALLLPQGKREDVYDKLEINRYKRTATTEDVWEVSLDLHLFDLGKIEVRIKMQAGNLYAQIWTESLATEKLLLEKKKDLESFCPNVQIFSVKDGPLFINKEIENIDLLV